MTDGDLRAAVEAWIRALDTEDVAALTALAAPEAVFLAPGQEPAVGRDAWLARRSRRLHGVQLRCDIEAVAAYGSHGYAWYEVRLTVPAGDGDPEVRVEGHTMALYRRDDGGRWLLTHEAAMLAPARS